MKTLCILVAFLLVIPLTGFAATIYVPKDYGTIQEAIDAAVNGDTIIVDPGDYEEQLTIDGKILAIKGSGVDVTNILSPPALQTTFVTSQDNKCIVGVINSGGLGLSNVTVDGQGRGNGNYRFVGIGVRNSLASIKQVKVMDVTETPLSGAQHGIGVYAYNDDGIDRDISLTSSTISGYQKNAMALSGPNVFAKLKGCITLGYGPTNLIAQNGIQISYGAGGELDDCVAYGNVYTDPGWTSCGILLYEGTTVDVKNCPIIKNNHTGAYFVRTSGTFINSSITAGIDAMGYDDTYWGLGIDDQGPLSPRARPFGAADAGHDARAGRSTTTVIVANSDFDADQAGDGVGVGAWAQSNDNVVVDIIDCRITDWPWGIEVSDDGTATPTVEVYHCDITGNVDHGIINYSTAPVLAEYNWWGDPTGPYHPTLNPGGLGDPVSDNVDFDPWHTGAESLDADLFLLDAMQNQTVNLSLDAGAGNANRDYLILGSISGTEPGTPLPGGAAVLPLNWDIFTSIMIPLLNTSLFKDFLGTLDPQGQGGAVMNIPALTLVPLMGQKLYFASALNAPWDFASNPIKVFIMP